MPIITAAQTLDAAQLNHLLAVWESAVRATHHFLTEEDIITLRPQVATALPLMQPLLLVSVTKDTAPVGFLGISGDKIEALFIHDAWRGQGLGKHLLQKALLDYHCRFVDVNEQNPHALGFYEHCGFHIISRSPTDESGRPFPILHLGLPQ